MHDREPPLRPCHPTLLLGMIGFTREQEREVDRFLRRPAPLVRTLSALHLAGSITTPLLRPAAVASPRPAEVRA